MFPPGSGTASSGALPTVWSDRAGFEASAAAMTAAASKLADLAAAGDAAGANAQWDALKAACNDCHTKYRKPDEKH
jgi:cytochrome c556